MYGAILHIDVAPNAKNATEIAARAATAVEYIWSKVIINDEGKAYARSLCQACVQQAGALFDLKLEDVTPDLRWPTMDLSPFAHQDIAGIPRLDEPPDGLRFNLRTTRYIKCNLPNQFFLRSNRRKFGIRRCEPEFIESEFLSGKHHQEFDALRHKLLNLDIDKQLWHEWQERSTLDDYDRKRLWVDGATFLIFNISALAYLITSITQRFPVSKMEVETGQISCD